MITTNQNHHIDSVKIEPPDQVPAGTLFFGFFRMPYTIEDFQQKDLGRAGIPIRSSHRILSLNAGIPIAGARPIHHM